MSGALHERAEDAGCMARLLIKPALINSSTDRLAAESRGFSGGLNANVFSQTRDENHPHQRQPGK